MLKTIYFDIGNVLCFFDHDKMFCQIGECTGLTLAEIRILLKTKKIQEDYDLGKLTTKQLFEIVRKESPKTILWPEFIHAISDIFTPNMSLWPLVEQLKRQGKRLVIISNTCESHYNYIEKTYPILQWFDEKILSFQVGVAKPDPRIFEKALSIAKAEPHECFYTDDIPAFVESARKVGLNGAVYTTTAELQRDLKKQDSSTPVKKPSKH